MTKPATASEYMTMPVPTVVGGTPKVWTMPPIETGREATLNDMIAWPSAIAIIGTQDSLGSARELAGAAATVVMGRRSQDQNPWRQQGGATAAPFHSKGFETNMSNPRLWDRNLATSCPLTLLPAASSGGAKVPRPPLPGETVTIPPPMPLLPGSPMS